MSGILDLGIGSGIKWMAIAALGLSIIGGAAWLANTIESNGQYKLQVQIQNKELESRNNTIDALRREIELINEIITDRDDEIGELETRLDGILDDLPDDLHDLAPASIREYLRRLNER